MLPALLLGLTTLPAAKAEDLVFRQVAAGTHHTVAIKGDATLWAWGCSYYAQLGDGTTTANKFSPVEVGTATNWQAVAAGGYHTVALKRDGTPWAWGGNGYGQLGNGTTANQSSPVEVGTATNWQAVAAGLSHTLALKSDGTLWAWGENEVGQLGQGPITPCKIGLPVILTQPQDQSVQAGARVSFSVAITGSQPWSYQWQLNGTNLADNARLSGSQYASLTLFNPLPRDAGSYQVVVTNSYGSITSAVATLTVTLPPVSIQYGMLPDRSFGLSFNAVANLPFRLEASTNLLEWETLTNYADPAGPVEYLDQCATNFPQRFYRAVWAP